MPELPEVETTRLGLAPHLVGHRITRVIVRDPRLRWPVAPGLTDALTGQRILALDRRAKYLIVGLERGSLIVHLGMSGALAVVARGIPPGKHDHLDLEIEERSALRLTDPRRFGSVHLVAGDPGTHVLLASLGPEPLSPAFNADQFFAATRGRSASIKEILMNAHIVAGIGNIYANEALFRAHIHPRAAAGRIGRERCATLVQSVQATLAAALDAGGSSLRDWRHADGSSGYFQQTYFVYGRGGEACRQCGATIREIRQGQRATYYCPRCQRR